MTNKIHLEIVTPERPVLSEDVDEVTAPGILGEFDVLPGHTTFLAELGSGLASFTSGSERRAAGSGLASSTSGSERRAAGSGRLTYTKSGQSASLNIAGGFAEVRQDCVTILADEVQS